MLEEEGIGWREGYVGKGVGERRVETYFLSPIPYRRETGWLDSCNKRKSDDLGFSTLDRKTETRERERERQERRNVV